MKQGMKEYLNTVQPDIGGLLLIKISDPGWEKQFPNEIELLAELKKHICGRCYAGENYDDDNSPKIDPDNCTIEELLCTPCGCEFDVQDVLLNPDILTPL